MFVNLIYIYALILTFSYLPLFLCYTVYKNVYRKLFYETTT